MGPHKSVTPLSLLPQSGTRYVARPFKAGSTVTLHRRVAARRTNLYPSP
jgi:hypothetical protein